MKVLPYTTEMEVRKLTRKFLLKEIKEALEANKTKNLDNQQLNEIGGAGFQGMGNDPFGLGLGPLASNLGGSLFADKDVAEVTNLLSNAALGQFLLIAKGNDGLGPAINFLDDKITFPVWAQDFSEVYSFWHAFISNDRGRPTLDKSTYGTVC